MDIAARAAVLARVPLFAELGPDACADVARLATEQPLAKTGVLFRQGQDATHSYVVGWGRLRLDQATPDGDNVLLRYMGPGDMIGTVAVLRGIPFPATPTAVEDSMLLAWSAPRTAELLQRYPAVGLAAIALIGDRIGELQDRLREVATQRVERRIAATLLRLVRQTGRRVDGGIEIPFAIARNDLAEMTATTLHTVSRTLAAWEQQGILSGKRSAHLVIARPHRLVEIAEQS